MIKNIKEEIDQAKFDLGITDAQIRLLSDDEGIALFAAVEEHFVDGKNWTWWWEHFRSPAAWAHFRENDGFEELDNLVPSASERVWFIAEDSLLRHSPVYEADTATIQRVVGNCRGFEYYIVAKDFGWLLGENHHSALFAVGEPVRSNVEELTEPIDIAECD